MVTMQDLNVKVFADGADAKSILEHAAKPYVAGFTTNPTLMRKAGITDYESFPQRRRRSLTGRFRSRSSPMISTKCLSRHARLPPGAIMFTSRCQSPTPRREQHHPLLCRLAPKGIKLNATAIFTRKQIEETADALANAAPSYIPVFAGRVAQISPAGIVYPI